MPSRKAPKPSMPSQAPPNRRAGSKYTPNAKVLLAGRAKVSQAPLNRRPGSKYTPKPSVIAAGRRKVSQAPANVRPSKAK